MQGSLCVVFFACLVVSCLGHAHLAAPTAAWNLGYSKTAPCGAGVQPTVSSYIWPAGSTQTLKWEIIAGDGTGPVTIALDSAGSTGFTGGNLASSSNPSPTTTGVFDLQFTIPSNLNCSATGNNGLCNLQFKSSTNWYSCVTFRTQAAAAAASSSTAPTCQVASGLTTCVMVNGKRVAVPFGQTLTSMEDSVRDALANTLPNPTVFNYSSRAGCAESYKAYMCGSTFALCPNPNTPPTAANSCKKVCNQMVCFCGLTTLHEYLYDCSKSTNAGADAYGDCDIAYGPGNTTCSLSSTAGGSGGSNPSSGASVFPSVAALFVAVVGLLLTMF